MDKAKKMTKREQWILYAAIGVFIAGILLLVFLVIVPKYAGQKKIGKYTGDEFEFKSIGFNDSEWVLELVEQKVLLFEPDFVQDMAFSYSGKGGYLRILYASGKAADECTEHYRSVLENVEVLDDKTEAIVDLVGTVGETNIEIKNFFSDVTNLYRITVYVDEETTNYIKMNTEAVFPQELLAANSEIFWFMSGEPYGGYLRYNTNEFSETSYANIPAASRAFVFEGGKEAFAKNQKELEGVFSGFRYDEDGSSVFFEYEGYLIKIAYTVNDEGVELSTVNAQAIPKTQSE